MVLMEDSRDKLSLVLDRDPEGFSHILECSDILEASHIREVSDARKLALSISLRCWQTFFSKFALLFSSLILKCVSLDKYARPFHLHFPGRNSVEG